MSAPVENLVQRLNAKRSGNGWMARCPNHRDRTPSLSITEGSDGRALIKCWAGCNTEDVLTALGMKYADLFPTPPAPAASAPAPAKGAARQAAVKGSSGSVDVEGLTSAAFAAAVITPVPYIPPPLALLPAGIQDYVRAASESLNVDVAFVLLPLLSALGSAIGNSRAILLKRNFTQPPVIWTGNRGAQW